MKYILRIFKRPASTKKTSGGSNPPASLQRCVETAPQFFLMLKFPSSRRFPIYGSKRLKRRELLTTDTELKAMAAPAMTGDKKPRAAKGIPMLL